MKQNLLALGFGVLVCALLSALTYWIYPAAFARFRTPDGSQFESIDDLRQSLLERDDRDLRTDGGVSLRTVVRPHPSDKIIYELRPNLNIEFRSVNVRTNSHGMRNPETPVEKPANTYRIALLGDSFAFGWAVEQDRIFARVLELELNRRHIRKEHIEVLNFGVPGYATFQEVAQFLDSGAQFQPDAVIVYFIKNDFGLPFFIKDLQSENGSLVPAPMFHHTSLDPADEAAQARKAELLRSLDANRALCDLAEYCRDHNIKLFLTFHPDNAEEKMRKRVTMLRAKDTKKLIVDLSIADTYKSYVEKGLVPASSLDLPHDDHPGPGAHLLLGLSLADRLTPYISESPAPSPAVATSSSAQTAN